MKKIILVVAILLCTLLLCTSCGGKEVSPAEFYENEPYEAAYSYTEAKALSAIGSEWDYVESGDGVILFEDEDNYYVYDVEAAKVAKTIAIEDNDVELVEIFGVDLILVENTTKVDDETKVTTTLYNLAGTAVVSGESDLDYDDDYLDLFIFNETIYRIAEDGTAAEVCKAAFFSIPEFDAKTADYYLASDGETITVYNSSLAEVSFWEAPHEECEELNIVPLSATRALIQYKVILDENEKKYDLFIDGEKFDLVSIILNLENGKEKSVDLDYVVDYLAISTFVVTPYGEDGMNYYEADNFVYINYIEDGKILTDRDLVVINAKNGKIKKEIAPECESFYRVAEDRYILTSKSGNKTLVNGEGDLIANLGTSSLSGNGTFAKKGDKIYDYDLNLIYDLDAKEATFIGYCGEGFIVSKFNETDNETENYIVAKDGTEKKIADYRSCSANYYVTKNEGTYTFCKADGTSLVSVKADYYDTVYTDYINNSVIIAFAVENGTAYYMFK